jgi:hypothetical protein
MRIAAEAPGAEKIPSTEGPFVEGVAGVRMPSGAVMEGKGVAGVTGTGTSELAAPDAEVPTLPLVDDPPHPKSTLLLASANLCRKSVIETRNDGMVNTRTM